MKRWWDLRREKLIAEETLVANDYVPRTQLGKEYLHTYLTDDDFKGNKPTKPIRTIKEDTLFWYEAGRFPSSTIYPVEIAGVFLKGPGVISQRAQNEARRGLLAMNWIPPDGSRPETLTAIERQKGHEDCGELLFGYTNHITIQQSRHSWIQHAQFTHLLPILREMDAKFAEVLPDYYYRQNTLVEISKRKRLGKAAKAGKVKRPHYGGPPPNFRKSLTNWSNATLLRSCPASIHRDDNAREDETNFTCLTSVFGDPQKPFSGGTFFLPEYGLKIPVRPGDVFIAQTSRDWHMNLDPVDGLKFSIVAYYKTRLANTNYTHSSSVYRSLGEWWEKKP